MKKILVGGTTANETLHTYHQRERVPASVHKQCYNKAKEFLWMLTRNDISFLGSKAYFRIVQRFNNKKTKQQNHRFPGWV